MTATELENVLARNHRLPLTSKWGELSALEPRLFPEAHRILPCEGVGTISNKPLIGCHIMGPIWLTPLFAVMSHTRLEHLRRVAGLLHEGSAHSAVNWMVRKATVKITPLPLWIDSMCVLQKCVFHLSSASCWTFTTPDHGAKMGGKSKSHFFEEEVLNVVGEGEKWQSRSILFVTKTKLPI